jgi:hypothetical protein
MRDFHAFSYAAFRALSIAAEHGSLEAEDDAPKT